MRAVRRCVRAVPWVVRVVPWVVCVVQWYAAGSQRVVLDGENSCTG